MHNTESLKLLPIGILFILLSSCNYNGTKPPIKSADYNNPPNRVKTNHQYPEALPLRYSKQNNRQICPLKN